MLDVGTGSGYHAAVLARLCGHVWSIERHAELSARAARSLAAAGVTNVTLLVGDGALGVPEAAPFDAINIAAAAVASVPAALEAQLADGGRLVAPVEDGDQRLWFVRYEGGELEAPHAGARALRPARHLTVSSRSFGRYSRPTFAHGLPSTITTSAVKSFAPRSSEEPTP